MKKLLISGLTIATLMGSLATSASAGWNSNTTFGTTYITGTGSHSGSGYNMNTTFGTTYIRGTGSLSGQNYSCSTSFGTTTCN